MKNRVETHIEKVVLICYLQASLWTTESSNELKKQGVFISSGGIRCLWLRHNPGTFKKRLKALEEKTAKENQVLTESQLQALEKPNKRSKPTEDTFPQSM